MNRWLYAIAVAVFAATAVLNLLVLAAAIYLRDPAAIAVRAVLVGGTIAGLVLCCREARAYW